jgi:hypothetical protein
MNAPHPEQQQPQQFQDPTPLIRALQNQRNQALDQLADTAAGLDHAHAHIEQMSKEHARQTSLIDELNMQLESTKTALAEVQSLNATLDASNVALTRELDQIRPVAG